MISATAMLRAELMLRCARLGRGIRCGLTIYLARSPAMELQGEIHDERRHQDRAGHARQRASRWQCFLRPRLVSLERDTRTPLACTLRPEQGQGARDRGT